MIGIFENNEFLDFTFFVKFAFRRGVYNILVDFFNLKKIFFKKIIDLESFLDNVIIHFKASVFILMI